MRRGLSVFVILGIVIPLVFAGCGRKEEKKEEVKKERKEEMAPATVEEKKPEGKAEVAQERPPEVREMAGDPEAGKAIYEGVCVACHGAGGNAVIPGVPSFAKGEAAGGKKLSEVSDEQLKNSIKTGFPSPSTPGAPPMPPYGGGAPLDEKQLADLIAYIRSLAK